MLNLLSVVSQKKKKKCYSHTQTQPGEKHENTWNV